MQCVSLTYLKSLISDNCFQPEGMPSDAVSGSTAILIAFLSDEQHMAIQHVHIGLVVQHIGCNLYDQDGIPPFINSIEEDLKKARQKWDMGKDPGRVCSYTMLVTNFFGIMAIPTDPPYCLVYPVNYSDDVATKNQNHFNTTVSLPGLCTCSCICCALLQHADLMEAHRWKYNGSHLIVPCGAQYKTLFPEITMPHNHRGPLINHSSRKPYPMVPVGDFSPVDKIFPGSPVDSLLFNGKELARLKRKGLQVSTFQEEKPYPSSPKREKQLSSCSSGDVLGSSSRKGEPPKTSSKSYRASSHWAPPDSTSSKKLSSHHSKCSPSAKEWCDKESHSTSTKHKDKSNSDKSKQDKHGSNKAANKSPHKHHVSPPSQPSSTERAGKEHHLEDTTQTSSADTHSGPQSPSNCMSKTKDQSSFTAPSSTSTPNKIGSMPRFCSSSTDSRCSLTPLDTSLYGSFSYLGPHRCGPW